ncbi:hypothetical protein G7A66_10055 [Altererythrobacter sp. SALINAS58]|uniref:hypothetical protein n=1 Tax=Alteripontixanthobacter muriae TaxID=2705546 RepID=UPI0019D57B54|nr:hypothetical protein [Alteripontixanthobacter muriae]NTZ43416.1 hypothetical protein [Alteripontixanthobacter muriae]
MGGRAPLAWATRIALSIGVAVVGYFGVTSSLANVVQKSDPELAYTLDPSNGVIAAAYAQHIFTLRPTTDRHALPSRLAKQALRLDPTAVDALTVLGFQAQLLGDAARSDEILAHSTQLSRRELRPQLWAIEEAVSRGDVQGALRHYDIALRTSNDARAILFPTLTAALSEPKIRSALLQVMESGPVWREAFIDYAAKSGAAPEDVAQFFQLGRRVGLPVSADHRAQLVDLLINQGEFEKAWDYFLTFRGGDRNRSRDPNFMFDGKIRSAFDWSFGKAPGLSVAILQSPEGGILDFALPPSVGGVVVRQLQLLPAGTYRLQGLSTNIEQPLRSQPYWALLCLDGRELGRVPITSSSDANSFSGLLTVPQNCDVQTLELVARASDKASGVAGQINKIEMMPNVY